MTQHMSALRPQRLADCQKIPPREPLLERRAQQIGRMERRNGADFARAGMIVAPAAARSADAVRDAEQGGTGGAAEAHQDVRIGKFDLSLDEWQANLTFLRR